MPTGYTAQIEDRDDYTFEEYAWTCARACSEAVRMRDYSLATKIDERLIVDDSPHYAVELKRDRARLEEMCAMTEEQADVAAEAEYRAALRSREECLARQANKARRYAAMRERCEAWRPPDSLLGLKDFMLDQIRISTEYEYSPPEPTRESARQWLTAKRQHIVDSIAYNGKHEAERLARNAERLAWVRTLQASIGPAKVAK